MDPKKQQKLYDKYPQLFAQKDLPMSKTCMCWGIQCGDGWFALLETMCRAIDNHIQNHKELECEFVQVKEKLGTLRVGYEGGDDYIAGAISMAEHMSAVICENCGAPGTVTNDGWLRCECFNCYTERRHYGNNDNDTKDGQ